MSLAEIPGESPVRRRREVLAQRPPPGPWPPSPAPPAWWDGPRAALPAFARQVLLRPVRIGTLALLGGLVAIVLVGAEDWWIVLGIILFQAAASTLIAVWVDVPAARLRQPAELAPDCFAWDPVPRPRQPRPDE